MSKTMTQAIASGKAKGAMFYRTGDTKLWCLRGKDFYFSLPSATYMALKGLYCKEKLRVPWLLQDTKGTIRELMEKESKNEWL